MSVMNAPQPNLSQRPLEVEVVDRVQEAPTIFTLQLQLTDAAARAAYRFQPGQFNMLYLYGVGEVAISIVSDPDDAQLIGHTIRVVGRVTRGLDKLRIGDRIGLRGPYGRGWPLTDSTGHDILVVTGGLGCAPVISVIHYVLRRRADYGHLTIVQGVKHAHDLIWREHYDRWQQTADTTVLLATDRADAGGGWPWHVGRVTDLFDEATIHAARTRAMLCGPEGMMHATIRHLRAAGMADDDIFVSMERNMQCAVGLCGHCQFGPRFVCRDGPVFPYSAIADLFGTAGF